jgi:hypothetical protein
MRYPLTKIKENDICAEIGVWKGSFSSKILKRKPSKLHLIDPWKHQNYKKMWYSIEQEKMDKIYHSVQKRFADDNRVELHRSFSTEVEFPKEYFDWVYIDGDHTYPMVLKDLDFYYPLVKKGGFLCGDDYGWTSVDCPFGPKRAVNEFVKVHNAKIEIIKNQFVIFC